MSIFQPSFHLIFVTEDKKRKINNTDTIILHIKINRLVQARKSVLIQISSVIRWKNARNPFVPFKDGKFPIFSGSLQIHCC